MHLALETNSTEL